jgi:predicted acylesterase/phospholipase RssA
MINMFVHRAIKKKFKKESMTFLEFIKATGKNFIVCAARIPSLENVYFSADATPDVDIALAIRASCSLPFIFTPVEIGNHIYIDAGLVHNFPCDILQENTLKDTLGINIKGSSKYECDLNKLTMPIFLRIIFDSMMRRLNSSHGAPPPCITVVEIAPPNTDGFDIHFDMETCTFKIPENKIKEYTDFGYACIKKNFESLAS